MERWKEQSELELVVLILACLNGTANHEQYKHLEKTLQENPEALSCYHELLVVYCGLHQPEDKITSLISPEVDLELDPGKLLQDAIERDEKTRAEKTAEEKRRETEAKKNKVQAAAKEAFAKFLDDERRRQEKLAYKKYKTRQRALLAGISALAASLIIALAWIIIPKIYNPASIAPPLVATVTEIRNAQWKNPKQTVSEGIRLSTARMELKRGIVQVTFDDGAEVIFQAPCMFKLENSNQMYLESGNLVAIVPKEAIGFTVRTNGATVVDYGTEFGVTARTTGETEAHVFRGEVDIRSGSDIKVYQQSQRLRKGEANKVDSKGNIPPVKYKANANRFIRKIPEQGILSLPGQRLDLSDIVTGGNGFGTGPHGYALHPDTGAQVPGIMPNDSTDQAYYMGNCKYNLVEASPFVDGVFVPDGGEGPIKISSTGLTFDECPDTTGTYYVEIFNSASINNLVYQGWQYKFVINGKPYNTPANPAISMHANVGITFDLDQIRASIPGCRIVKFHALTGISEDMSKKVKSRADFWVLIDGEVIYSRRVVSAVDGGEFVNIDLNERNRFLTLITTDSSTNDNIDIGHDWCVVAKPTLELTF